MSDKSGVIYSPEQKRRNEIAFEQSQDMMRRAGRDDPKNWTPEFKRKMEAARDMEVAIKESRKKKRTRMKSKYNYPN